MKSLPAKKYQKCLCRMGRKRNLAIGKGAKYIQQSIQLDFLILVLKITQHLKKLCHDEFANNLLA